jgi:hypothetical protein
MKSTHSKVSEVAKNSELRLTVRIRPVEQSVSISTQYRRLDIVATFGQNY